MGKMLGWKMKVVEKGGKMLRDLLTRSNIFAGEGCGRPNCAACSSAAKPVNCRRRGIVFVHRM